MARGLLWIAQAMRTNLFAVLFCVGMSVQLAAAPPAEARRKKSRIAKSEKSDPRVQAYAEILRTGAYATHDEVVRARTTPDGSTRVLFEDGVLAEIRGTIGPGNKAEIRVLIPGKKADPLTVLPKDPDLADGAPGYTAHVVKVQGGSVMPEDLRYQPSEKPHNAAIVTGSAGS